ncbi:hypothetical protein NC652_024312 [Populus alba x Populus x berolinensis]|nr:hypothetical protein NC652_024312 [Populus alba x Populus x berolinensis]
MRRSKETGKRQSRLSSPSRPSRSGPSPPRSRKSTLSSSASSVDNLEVVSEQQSPFTTGSELFDEPRSFPYSVKQQCWEKAEKVKGRDPDRWRRDPLGNIVFRKLVLQATVNRSKGNRTELSRAELIRRSSYCRVSGRDMDFVELSAYGNVRREQESVNFAQKHEARQVYVRSTARVYEIYYAPELQSSGEYLCTVCCGIAARNEEVQHATNIEEAVLAHARSSIQGLAEEKLRNGRSLTPNENDWFEVKVLDSPPVINRNSSSPSNSDINPKRNSQVMRFALLKTYQRQAHLPPVAMLGYLPDLYEAAAEITDAKPSTSLTLRLLSLRNKGYVCVDEVYVFGDPVDTSSLDNQVGLMENSAGNSLMAMLVPAVFQLSQTKGIGGGEDKYNIDTRERQELQEIGSKEAVPVDVEKKIQEEVRLHKVVGPTSKPVQHNILQQVSNTQSKSDISHNHFEGVLDQLVARVNRIEDLFLRFEESMLKPINSIDVRLQRVEQQLDVLTKKTESSALVSGTRISAPEFSCSESETSSFYNSGSGDIVNDTNLQPGLVVTAPEFSNYDDEVEDHAVESVKESPKVKQKHAMSTDDALAYALAGFSSSTSMQSQKYSQTFAFKAPDFPSEEENTNEKAAPPVVESELNIDPSPYFSESDGTEHMGISLSSVSNVTTLKDDENVMRYLDDNRSLKMAVGVDEQCQHSKGGESDSQDICGGHAVAPATCDVAGTDSYQMISDDRRTDDIKDGEVGDGTSDIFRSMENLKQFSVDQPNDGFLTIQEVAVSNELVASTEGTEEESKHSEGGESDSQDIYVGHAVAPATHDVAGTHSYQMNHGIKDGEEVAVSNELVASTEGTEEESKQDIPQNISPLEALTAGMPDLEVEVPPVMEDNNDGSGIGDQCNLISAEDFGAIYPHFSGYGLSQSLNETPSIMEADKLHDCYTSSGREMPASITAATREALSNGGGGDRLWYSALYSRHTRFQFKLRPW